MAVDIFLWFVSNAVSKRDIKMHTLYLHLVQPCILIVVSNPVVNPSSAEATFVHSTRTQRFLKNTWTLSCWYSLDSSCWVLSEEYPFTRVSVIFQVFMYHFVLAKLATSSIKVKDLKVIFKFKDSNIYNYLSYARQYGVAALVPRSCDEQLM